MVPRPLLDDVLALPIGDRLELFEQLRQNLLDDPEFDPPTEEEKLLLDQRLGQLESDPHSTSPWDVIEARLIAKSVNRTEER